MLMSRRGRIQISVGSVMRYHDTHVSHSFKTNSNVRGYTAQRCACERIQNTYWEKPHVGRYNLSRSTLKLNISTRSSLDVTEFDRSLLDAYFSAAMAPR
jgi:hypothetical protein